MEVCEGLGSADSVGRRGPRLEAASRVSRPHPGSESSSSGQRQPLRATALFWEILEIQPRFCLLSPPNDSLCYPEHL